MTKTKHTNPFGDPWYRQVPAVHRALRGDDVAFKVGKTNHDYWFAAYYLAKVILGWHDVGRALQRARSFDRWREGVLGILTDNWTGRGVPRARAHRRPGWRARRTVPRGREILRRTINAKGAAARTELAKLVADIEAALAKSENVELSASVVVIATEKGKK